jgi:multidrug efflux pump subunit AcrA (membrane-fusion protein)
VAQRQQTLADAQTATQTDTSDAAKQKVTRAQASLDYAQNSLKHFQDIYESDYIPETFTQARTFNTRRGIKTVVTKIEDTTTGELINLVYPPTEGEIGMAQSAYDLAKASIGEAQTYLDVLNGEAIPDGATGANIIAYLQAKHTLETAQYNLSLTQLVAPIDGTISALSINTGDLVTKGTSVITLSNFEQPYEVDAYIDAKDWGQIQTGYEADATFDIIPDQVFKGTVINVYPTLDTTSSNSALIHFTVRLNTPITYELPSGAATSVQVIGGNAKNAVLVPLEALHEFGDGKYAVFVMTNGKLRLRVVEVGLKDLTKAEILSGLRAGDVISTGVVKTK